MDEAGIGGSRLAFTETPGAVVRGWPRTHPDGHERALAAGRSRAVRLSSLARLLRNVLDLAIDHCPHGGSEQRIVGAIPGRLAIEKAFTHRGQRAQPPRKEQLQLPKNLARTAVSAVTAGRSVVLVVGVDELDMGRQRSESFASIARRKHRWPADTCRELTVPHIGRTRPLG